MRAVDTFTCVSKGGARSHGPHRHAPGAERQAATPVKGWSYNRNAISTWRFQGTDKPDTPFVGPRATQLS
jgi:hypothetical protein